MALYESIEETAHVVDRLVREKFGKREDLPTEDEVRAEYREFFGVFSNAMDFPDHLENEVVDDLVHSFLIELEVTKAVGSALVDGETRPWLNAANESIENEFGWFYWNRYEEYLRTELKWNEASVRSLAKDTWNVLDLMADPLGSDSFDRRGLVVASVQSGKTANYTGLITRAADAGYKVIIVLAGIHNGLRDQTQQRIEEGFSGIDISKTPPVPVGVGGSKFVRSTSRRPLMFTSRENDFSKARANALMTLQTKDSPEPIVFVIKKISNSLKQVREWINENAERDDALLLIDDEADNASINVRYRKNGNEEDNPTRINGQIRKILSFFNKRCYVGYTATPFANILIDPDVDDESHGSDLFPRSFIYTLEESSDYFGARKVFEDFEKPIPKHLRRLHDISDILPPNHKSDSEFPALPSSLEEAVRTFIVASAIRSLRGDGEKHSTMMVNISPYTGPQKRTEFLLHKYVESLRQDIRSYSGLGSDIAKRSSETIEDLFQTWNREYSHLADVGWDDILKNLPSIAKRLATVLVNSRTNDILEYGEEPKCIIAVGGYRLSRGLTLEGLIVSYYSRNARAYDALMQMARWFGYRPRFEDLVRVWMSEENAGWYAFVAKATEELMQEFRRMHQLRRTPKDFGLKIRQSPDSLMVTARNKIGTGEFVPVSIDPSGKLVETIALLRDPETVESNRQAIATLLVNVSHCRDESAPGILYRHVPYADVLEFLSDFQNDDVNSPNSSSTMVSEYIERRLSDGELEDWDLHIAQGSLESREFIPRLSVRFEQRYPGDRTSANSVVIGSKNRLSSRGIDKVGLNQEQIKDAEESFYQSNDANKSVSDVAYREKRPRPMLVLHPLSMEYSQKQIEERRGPQGDRLTIQSWPSLDHSEVNYGWSISFPRSNYPSTSVNYVLNSTALREMFGSYEGDEDEDDQY